MNKVLERDELIYHLHTALVRGKLRVEQTLLMKIIQSADFQARLAEAIQTRIDKLEAPPGEEAEPTTAKVLFYVPQQTKDEQHQKED